MFSFIRKFSLDLLEIFIILKEQVNEFLNLSKCPDLIRTIKETIRPKSFTQYSLTIYQYSQSFPAPISQNNYASPLVLEYLTPLFHQDFRIFYTLMLPFPIKKLPLFSSPS